MHPYARPAPFDTYPYIRLAASILRRSQSHRNTCSTWLTCCRLVTRPTRGYFKFFRFPSPATMAVAGQCLLPSSSKRYYLRTLTGVGVASCRAGPNAVFLKGGPDNSKVRYCRICIRAYKPSNFILTRLAVAISYLPPEGRQRVTTLMRYRLPKQPGAPRRSSPSPIPLRSLFATLGTWIRPFQMGYAPQIASFLNILSHLLRRHLDHTLLVSILPQFPEAHYHRRQSVAPSTPITSFYNTSPSGELHPPKTAYISLHRKIRYLLCTLHDTFTTIQGQFRNASASTEVYLSRKLQTLRQFLMGREEFLRWKCCSSPLRLGSILVSVNASHTSPRT